MSIGPYGGEVYALAQTDGAIYAATNGGVFRSTDRAKSWSPFNRGLPQTPTRAIAVSADRSQVFVATDTATVYRIESGRKNWSRVSRSDRKGGLHTIPGEVTSLVGSPMDSDTLYMTTSYYGAADLSNLAGTGRVLRSTDGGVTWKAADRGIDGNLTVNTVVFDPTDPETMYAAAASGVYKTTNGGERWKRTRKGIKSTEVRTVALDPNRPKTLYAGTDLGIFKTEDGAQNWHSLAQSPERYSGVEDPATEPSLAISVDPKRKEILLATPSGLFTSSDGKTWLNKNANGLEARSFLIDHGSKRAYLATASQGVWASGSDRRDGWHPVNTGLSATDVKRVVFAPSDPKNMYVLADRNEVFRTEDGGRSWKGSNLGNRFGTVGVAGIAVDPTDAKVLYAATNAERVAHSVSKGDSPDFRYDLQGGVYKSTDGGATWKLQGSRTGLPNLKAIAVDPVDPSVLYAASERHGIYRSADQGLTWKSYNTGIEGWGRAGTAGNRPSIFTRSIAVTADRKLYLAADRFYQRGHNDPRWTPVSADLVRSTPDNLLVSPPKAQALYASGGGNFFHKRIGGKWREIKLISPQFSGPAAYDGPFAFDPLDQDTFYAATGDRRLLRTSNAGATWERLPISLPKTKLNSLTVDPETPTVIYAGTAGGGLYAYRVDKP